MANVKIDNLADEIMNGLKEYADLATDDLKKSVRKAGNTVRKDIAASCPLIFHFLRIIIILKFLSLITSLHCNNFPSMNKIKTIKKQKALTGD